MTDELQASSNREFEQTLRSMAKTLELREDFLIDLIRTPDDWSFVVKCHALLESAVCTWLSAYLRKPELEETLALKVAMSARIDMLSALNLGTTAERRMMRVFGTFRNTLVHNAKQTDFTFAEYLKDKDRRNNFAELYAAMGGGDPELVLKSPRVAMWGAVVQIALHTVNEKVRNFVEEQLHVVIQGLIGPTTEVYPPTVTQDPQRGDR
jgi:hypothetical protein